MKINYTNINPGTFGNYTRIMRRITGNRNTGRVKGCMCNTAD